MKIPQGMQSVTPHLVCAGAAKAIEFYKQAFGATEMCAMPAPDGRIMHAEIRIDGKALFLCDDFPEFCGGKSESPRALGGTPVTIHRYVPDCDAAIQRAIDAGANGEDARDGHVLGRPLRRGRRPVRPLLVPRHPPARPDAGGDREGHAGLVRPRVLDAEESLNVPPESTTWFA